MPAFNINAVVILSAVLAWTFAGPAEAVTAITDEELAQRFAPIIYHAPDEPNYPTNVHAFLKKVDLRFYDSTCPNLVDILIKGGPSPQDLISQAKSPCKGAYAVSSAGTRSKGKKVTFYLTNVTEKDRGGSIDSRDWNTYYHIYRNGEGGKTIQYWRFYSFNTGLRLFGFEFGSHGGDWECVSVKLDGNNKPMLLEFPGHRTVKKELWRDIISQGTHPVVYPQWGSHTTRTAGKEGGVRQETWTLPQRGRVVWPSGAVTDTGELVKLGEKIDPTNGNEFLLYSGLWGAIGPTSISTGYWGPAYNETGMDDDFISAWCLDISDRGRSADGIRECYPTHSIE